MKRALILVMIVSLSLSGCWDQKVFEQIGFILNLGIESSKDEELLVTYTSPVIISGKEQENEVELIAVTGSILRDARTNARRRSAKLLEAGKIQQVLVSAELAQKRSVHELVEVLERDPIDPVQAWIVIADGSANDMLKKMMEFKDKPRPSVYINQLISDSVKSGYAPETKIYDFDINYFAPGVDPMTPLVKLMEKDVMITGSALFSEDKMVGKADHNQTFLLLAMRGLVKGSDYNLISPQPEPSEKKTMATTLKNCKKKIDLKLKDNKPYISISLRFDAYLSEFKWDKLSSEPEQKEIEEYIEGSLKKDCEEVLKYIQDIGSDPVGFGDMVRAKYSDYWKSINWKDAYKGASFNIEVKVEIKQYGVID